VSDPGPAIAQEISSQLSTAADRIKSCGICGEDSGSWEGFLKAFQFPLPVLIPPTAPYSSIIVLSTLYSLGTESVVKQEA
jgi:hypothetical protein